MKLLSWLDALGAVDSSALAPAAPRRAALARLGRGALAAVPAIAGALPTTAGPPTRVTSVTTDGLNLALRVAYPLRELVRAGLGGTSVLPAADRSRWQAHLAVVEELIAQVAASIRLSGDGVETANAAYDFTGNAGAGAGPLNPATSYDDFLVVAQFLTDTLSRTLLSSLSQLAGNTVFAELTGQLLGTTSRLAADARLLRQQRGTAVQPWIVGTDEATLPPVLLETTAAYAGEDSTMVYGVLQLTATTAMTGQVLNPVPPVAALTAAFDTPLPLASDELVPTSAVNQLLTPFRG